MSQQKTIFLRKELMAERTMLLTFAKPKGFGYLPGNSIDITLMGADPMDSGGNSRSFSLVSAPHEENLAVAIRMRDNTFKKTLSNFSGGEAVMIDGPFGSFKLPNDSSRPIILLAGGIGITPFYSMAKTAAHQKLPHQIYLFYSNRRPEDAPFLLELAACAKTNPNFRCISTMTDIEKSQTPWHGLTGYINVEMISSNLEGDMKSARYYIAGPPKMTSAMYAMLVGAGVDSDGIHTDEFAGY